MTFKSNVPVAGAATHSPSKPCLLCGRSGALNSGQKKKEVELKYHFQVQLIQTVPQDLLSLLLPVAEQKEFCRPWDHRGLWDGRSLDWKLRWKPQINLYWVWGLPCPMLGLHGMEAEPTLVYVLVSMLRLRRLLLHHRSVWKRLSAHTEKTSRRAG